MDNSGSMKKAGASLRARNLVKEFQNRLKPNDKFTVISFGDSPRIILQQKITSDKKRRVSPNLKKITFSEMFTDLHGGFSFLLDFLEKNKSNPDQTLVLFLTDGELDLVSQKNALFPQSILKGSDYKELLARYAPYIKKNSIKRDKIAPFNKELNSIGA
ncbi:MAG: vWA domain-containing protein, partial [Deltaproteobacteria bacterium]